LPAVGRNVDPVRVPTGRIPGAYGDVDTADTIQGLRRRWPEGIGHTHEVPQD